MVYSDLDRPSCYVLIINFKNILHLSHCHKDIEWYQKDIKHNAAECKHLNVKCYVHQLMRISIIFYQSIIKYYYGPTSGDLQNPIDIQFKQFMKLNQCIIEVAHLFVMIYYILIFYSLSLILNPNIIIFLNYFI